MKIWMLIITFIFSSPVWSGTIEVTDMKQKWGPLHLTASPQYTITSSDVIDEAINSGIVLSLIAKLHSYHSRDFWFDSTTDKQIQSYEIRYFSLSGQYQLHNTQSDERNSFVSLSELWRHLEHNTQFELPLNQVQLADYVSVRLRLDAGALPSAMQLPVLLSGDWRFKSEWVDFTLTKPQTSQRP